MLITLLQLSQMVVGITVTVASIAYHGYRMTCYVSLLNSLLGLLMYTSYFLLFFALFQKLYLHKKRSRTAADEPAGVRVSAAARPASKPPPQTGEGADFEGWAVGKGKEIELLAETSTEMANDVMS